MLRRLVRGLASPASATVSSSAIASSSATSRRALVTLAGRSSSNPPSSPIDALARRLSRIRLLPQVQRQQQQPLLALSTHARTAAAAAPPPPPPPPPPSSSAAAAAAALPPNLILADPEAVTAYRPVDLEAIERRVHTMVGPVPPERLTLPVLPSLTEGEDASSGSSSTVALDPRVFALPVRKDIVHRLVVWQRAKRRLGLAATKRVGEIRGSTKKLRPQKGSGRARAGKKHAPQFRGGYKAHGPVQRDFAIKLNKKVRALGLRIALSAKAREGNVVVVEHLQLPEAKTRVLDKALRAHDWASAASTTAAASRSEEGQSAQAPRPRRILLLDGDALDPAMALACRNLPYAQALPHLGANAIDLLGAEVLVLSRAGLDALTSRLLP